MSYSDLVHFLQERAGKTSCLPDVMAMTEAADEIKRLRTQIAGLTEERDRHLKVAKNFNTGGNDEQKENQRLRADLLLAVEAMKTEHTGWGLMFQAGCPECEALRKIQGLADEKSNERC
jgi:hypothetical protein